MSGEDEWGQYDSGPDILAQNKIDDLKDEVESLKAELKRFREREPLVQELIECAFDGDGNATHKAAEKVRDFEMK